MNISKLRAVFSVSITVLLMSLSVAAQDYLIVPGQRVGAVHLGATRAETVNRLGKASETKRWRSGLIKDSWLTPPKPNSEDPQIFFNVIYQANHVVQIEFNEPKYATMNGISIGSTLGEFRAKYKRPRVQAYGYDDGEGSGYVGYYYDDMRHGITFTLITQDLFDAGTVPDSLCVHSGGRPVIPNPGGKRHRPTDETPLQKNGTASVFTQHASKNLRQDNKSPEVISVITQFWDGLGTLDADKLKETMDWPVTIVEASTSRSKQSLVFRNPAEFDEEFKRTPAGALERHKSEFFGIKLMAFKVQMIASNLASVSYSYRLPPDIIAKNPKRAGIFSAVTVLRRDERPGSKWKIVFTTVPA